MVRDSTKEQLLAAPLRTSSLKPSAVALSPMFEDVRPADLLLLEGQGAWSEPHFLYWPLKRLFDIIVAVIALLLLFVLLIPIALLLFAEDGGPPLYRGDAIGFNGRFFKVFKIRTMRRDADVYFDQHPDLKAAFLENFKLENDPRVLRVGHFLRKTSLDELPQAINVLLGEMSWVGPRYVKLAELERYGTFAWMRLSMRPGITGLWQISGRSNLPYPLRTVYDRTYYYTRSLWTDFKIFWLTIPSVLKRDGAV